MKKSIVAIALVLSAGFTTATAQAAQQKVPKDAAAFLAVCTGYAFGNLTAAQTTRESNHYSGMYAFYQQMYTNVYNYSVSEPDITNTMIEYRQVAEKTYNLPVPGYEQCEVYYKTNNK